MSGYIALSSLLSASGDLGGVVGERHYKVMVLGSMGRSIRVEVVFGRTFVVEGKDTC